MGRENKRRKIGKKSKKEGEIRKEKREIRYCATVT